MAAEPTNGMGEPRARQDGAERPLGDPRRRLGARGERLARDHLEARGFEIVEANFRTRHGELDLVGRNERFLVFCEVKTRISKRGPGPLGPLSAIGPRKRRRLRLMAREGLPAAAPPSPPPPQDPPSGARRE